MVGAADCVVTTVDVDAVCADNADVAKCVDVEILVLGFTVIDVDV